MPQTPSIIIPSSSNKSSARDSGLTRANHNTPKCGPESEVVHRVIKENISIGPASLRNDKTTEDTTVPR